MRLLNVSMLQRLRNASDIVFARECAASLIAQLHLARDVAREDTQSSIEEAITCVRASDFSSAFKLMDNVAQSLVSQNEGGDGGLNRLIAGLYFSSAGSQCVAACATEARTAILEPWDVCQMVDQCCEDVSAFSREKYGVAPPIEVYMNDELAQPNQSFWISGIEGFIAFILGELLKNSAVSMMHRYGALDVEDASPVRVKLQTNGPFTLSVIDSGIGVRTSKNIWNYGYTTNASTHEAEWRYSRAHGAKLTGKGVGLPRSRVYAAFHIGTLEHKYLRSDETAFQLSLPGARMHRNVGSDRAVEA